MTEGDGMSSVVVVVMKGLGIALGSLNLLKIDLFR